MNDNETSNQDFKKPIDESDDDLCRALWLAVAVQGLGDATGKNATCVDKAQALSWIKNGERTESDFAAVCDLAGICPIKTKKLFEKVIKGEAETIDFRCMKRAKQQNRERENRRKYFRRARKNAANRVGGQTGRSAMIIRFPSNHQIGKARIEKCSRVIQRMPVESACPQLELPIPNVPTFKADNDNHKV